MFVSAAKCTRLTRILPLSSDYIVAAGAESFLLLIICEIGNCIERKAFSTMNEQGVQTESPAEQDSQSTLSEPHFDDIAIAIAQPVEPLSGKNSRWSRFGILRRHVSTTVLLVVLAGAIGFASMTFGLAGLHHRLTAEEKAAVTAPEQSAPVKIVDIRKSDTEKDLYSRPAMRVPRPRAGNTESKPVARLVGEIR